MKCSKWETSLFFTVLLLKHNECRGPLKDLNGTKLILDDHMIHFDSIKIYFESFRSFRGTQFPKLVTAHELFSTRYNKLPLVKNWVCICHQISLSSVGPINWICVCLELLLSWHTWWLGGGRDRIVFPFFFPFIKHNLLE